MNILINKLPTTVHINNESIQINSDFRNMIKIESIINDDEIDQVERVSKCLELFYGTVPLFF